MTQLQKIRSKLIEVYQRRFQKNNCIIYEVKGNRCYITFNRPKRYNAFSSEMYYILVNMIKKANQDPNVKFIVISGKGGNFSSGNDLSNFTDPELQEFIPPQHGTKLFADYLSDLCRELINSKKPLFAITEGKAIGFAFTQLALYDRVFAVETSQFNAPLIQVAQGPEMCASYTFPKIFGRQIGEELLVKGTKVGTKFLQKYGLVTSCKSREQADKALQVHLEEIDILDWNSYIEGRRLFREVDRQHLLASSEREIKNLEARWSNPQLPFLIVKYMSRVKAASKL